MPGEALWIAERNAVATSSGGFEKAPHPTAETMRWLHVLCFAASRIPSQILIRLLIRPGILRAWSSLSKCNAATDRARRTTAGVAGRSRYPVWRPSRQSVTFGVRRVFPELRG